MTTKLEIVQGLHHVSAITGDVQRNADFYTGVLGLRMVKVTINYDDPQTYHLYYGDALGRPGTGLTFFGWAGHPGCSGPGQTSEVAFNIPVGAAAWWKEHLAARGVGDVQGGTRFGQAVLMFKDPDGLGLALIEMAEASEEHFWPHGGIPAEVGIRGFHSVTLAASDKFASPLAAAVLVDHFGYREVGREGNRIRYETGGDHAGRAVDILVESNGAPAHMGTGAIHHVAFRTPTDEQQQAWLEQLRKAGLHVSPVMDRDYFHSIYFREPSGVLFEIATDTPGMTINESPETLGTRLMLPAWLEPERAQIEAGLPRLKLAEPLAELASAPSR